VTVEGIDKEGLVEGTKWEWKTFPEYRDAGRPARFGVQPERRRGGALGVV